jgi:hypothetical protein
MLARYQIIRGKRPRGSPLPDGLRIDARKHTRSILSPAPDSVVAYLANPTSVAFRRFASDYRKLLERRFRESRTEFDELAAKAAAEDVYIGCNCPTKANPDVNHCHTVLALHFLKKKYAKLKIVFPL